MLKSNFRQWLAISCLALLTTACGGGGGSGGSNSGSSSSTTSNSTSSSPTSSAAKPSNSTSSSSNSASSTTGNRIVRLEWIIPTTRADGTALPASSISGYRVFYTRDDSAASEDTVVTIDGGMTTNTNITLASSGTYTFAITATDISGAESGLSSPATLSVN